MIVTQKINMNLDEHGVPPWIDAVQGDAYARKIEVNLFSGGRVWEIPTDVQVLVRFQKPDGHGGEYDTLPDGYAASSVSGNTVTVVLIPQMLTTTGLVRVNVSLIKGITEISTFQILINVHPNVGAIIAESEDYYNVSGFLPMAVNAAVGQYIRVTAVDKQGVVKAVETAGVGDAVIDVPTNESHDRTVTEGNVLRRSFHLGNPISLGEYNGYRINKVGIRASAGTTVRFALYAVEQQDEENGIMTQIAVLGDAVADSETLVAQLTFEEGYEVRQDNTIILAFAQEAVLHCYALGSTLVSNGVVQFDDADYFGSENGTQIVFFNGETANEAGPFSSMYARDIELFKEQTLEQYIKETGERLTGIDKQMKNILPPITVLDNGKVLTAVDGKYTLTTPAEGGDSSAIPVFNLAEMGLPPVMPTGEYSRLNADMTKICEALDKGPVQFVVPMYTGVVENVTIVATALRSEGQYACTYVSNALGTVLYLMIGITENGMFVSVTPLVSYIDAYMEEALGGDY